MNGNMELLSNLILFLAVLGMLNLLVFSVFAADKNAARKNSWRISERTLILLSMFGPFGAFAAMKMFRHKTQKIKFYLIPLFAVLQTALLIGAFIYFT
jgi:uncharacterized membrane protein YsdA (DUF1294 family)